MQENITEKRSFPRIDGHFVVSYVEQDGRYLFDITQAKNVSTGGMLLTTSKQLREQTDVCLRILLPFLPFPITSVGKVLECREVIKDVVYDTRVKFSAMERGDRNILRWALEYFLKNRQFS